MKRFDLCSLFRRWFALTVAGVSLTEAGVTTTADASPTNAAPYLAAVRQFAGQVLAHGRDVYSAGMLTKLAGVTEPLVWAKRLSQALGNAAFLAQAEVIGRSILKHRVRNGWFVPSQRHVFCRVANDESQALLHLAAALMDKPEAVPAFTGPEPFFHAEYGTSTGRVYDSADIYGKTR